MPSCSCWSHVSERAVVRERIALEMMNSLVHGAPSGKLEQDLLVAIFNVHLDWLRSGRKAPEGGRDGSENATGWVAIQRSSASRHGTALNRSAL